jgi:hypothetical protein
MATGRHEIRRAFVEENASLTPNHDAKALNAPYTAQAVT